MRNKVGCLFYKSKLFPAPAQKVACALVWFLRKSFSESTEEELIMSRNNTTFNILEKIRTEIPLHSDLEIKESQ